MKEFLNSLPIDSRVDPISVGEYMGYQLSAPKSFWEAPEELRQEVIGGCGPGGLGDYFVPDTIWGMSIKAACAIHDWCFAVWDDKPGFSLSNNIFKNNMVRINDQNKSWAWLKRLRLRLIKKYYLAVNFFGEPCYFNS